MNSSLTRRSFLQSSAAIGVASQLAWASKPPGNEVCASVIVVHLRGGWDGLHVLAERDDPLVARRDQALGVRRRSALASRGPASRWSFCAEAESLTPLFEAGDLCMLPFCGTAARPRGHVDARQRLSIARGGRGWLAELPAIPDSGAVAVIPAAPPLDVLGLETSILSPSPCTLVLQSGRASERDVRGAAAAAEWSAESVEHGSSFVRRMFADDRGGVGRGTVGRSLDGVLSARDGGVNVAAAVIEDDGWDTHVAQRETMQSKLPPLCSALVEFWNAAKVRPWGKQVTLMVVSEFGRSIPVNGHGGTEHGHASLALVLRVGSAVRSFPGECASSGARVLRPRVGNGAGSVGPIAFDVGVAAGAWSSAGVAAPGGAS